ncbi:MAG: sigma 54-interacting transcriptional regulator [Acidobacteriaceae bacterium]|nr:sigma 54-interacting transcriptional regulator [Acidobacteriaceae bacterium]
MNAAVRAISGPLRGAFFRLVEHEVTIGRHPSNHLCIGDVSVSRQHCVIRSDGSRYKVLDLKSHNGTLINGKPLTEGFLKSGDRLTVGDTVFEFLEDAAHPPDLVIPISDRETVASLRVQQVKRSESVPDGYETEHHGASFAALEAMGRLLNSAEELENLEVRILERACDFLQAERAAVFLARKGEWVVFGCDKENDRCDCGFANRDIVDRSFKEGTFFVADFPEGLTSAVAVPLLLRGKVSGVLYFERKAQAGVFTKGDLQFTAALSNFEAVALHYSQKLRQLETENQRMRNEVQLRHQMIGQSLRMLEVYGLISRIAPTDATVLIRGETGTGKELAARAIHENSPRAGQTFVAINCALLKGDLLQSELFGHEKGSFTGAVAQKKGKLEVANHGTVFLDELAELPEASQSMLLRVLQEHAFERLGGNTTIRVDIRIIGATNKSLEEAVRARRFRQDLYYRLNVVSLTLPPLRERRDDIPLLARHFLRRAGEKNDRIIRSISPEAMAYLEAYDWPGNIRELENAIEHAIVFGFADQVMPEDLPEAILEATPKAAVPANNYQDAVKAAKKHIVLEALQRANGDHAKAAKALHIHPNNLYRLIRDLDVKSRLKT